MDLRPPAQGKPQRLLHKRGHGQQQAISAQTPGGWPGCRPSGAVAQGQGRRTGCDRNRTGFARKQLSLHQAAEQIALLAAQFPVPEQPGLTW
jgi:hypothetical protein